MKRTKLGRRVGALLLAIVMMFSVLPMTAFAADDETTVSETTEVIETEVPETEAPETEATEETEAPVETEAAEETEASEETEAPEETEVPEETEETEETVEETVEETTEETMDIEFLEEDIEPLAMGTKPSDGTTSGQPFKSGTGGSTYFRIPAMVTLNDGTIVAATDARWNQTLDNGGNDTIVSYSKDSGATWHYTFANYMGDNGNVYNNKSTCFIDPALATDGETVYMLVTLFPGGRALSNGVDGRPDSGDPFNDNGTLKLKKKGESSYNYYLDGYQIYKNDGTPVNYTVDRNFGNLFYRDADYQVMPTTYLCLTQSTDGGASWSDPKLLDVKKPDESFYGVGPGRGLVTSTGRIIFPCYTNPTEYTSFIYSDDKGETWKRTANLSDSSSETTLVEADGKLYAFIRTSNYDWKDIAYFVSEDNGSSWRKLKSDASIDPDTSCQMNAITYSEKIDGKTAILLSAPGTYRRQDGRIFVALVNEDGSLSWPYTYNVNSGTYAYSCLTELKNGRVALLYENGSGSENFVTYGIDEIAKGATIGDKPVDPTEPPVEEDKTVTDKDVSVTAPGLTEVEAIKTEREIAVAQNVLAFDVTPKTADGAKYEGAATVSYLIPGTWDPAKVRGFVVEDDDSITVIIGKIEDGKYIFTAPHFSVQGILELAAPTGVTEDVTLDEGTSTTKSIIGLDRELTNADITIGDPGVVSATITATRNTTEGTTRTVVVNEAAIGDGQFVIASNGSAIATSDGASISNVTGVAVGSEINKSAVWTVARSGIGYTISRQIGGRAYYLGYTRTRGNGLSADYTYTLSMLTTESVWLSNNNQFYQNLPTKNGIISGDNTFVNFYLHLANSAWGMSTTAANVTLYSVTEQDIPGATTWDHVLTITGREPGTTTVEVGGNTYKVTVNAKQVTPPEHKYVDVNLFVGEAKSFVDVTGNYTANGNGENIADVQVVGTDNNTNPIEVQEIVDGESYLIQSAKQNTYLLQAETTTQGRTARSLGTEGELWTIIETDSGYSVQALNGSYLDFDNYNNYGANALLSETAASLDLVFNGGTWTIHESLNGGEAYLNAYDANSAACYYAADKGSQWKFYSMNSQITNITFTGAELGYTEVEVGNTTYRIRVSESELELTGPYYEGGKVDGESTAKVTNLIIMEGSSYTLTPGYTNGADALGGTWVSNDTSTATVTNGTITGVRAGKTTVTYTAPNGKTVTVNVQVLPHRNNSNQYNKETNIYIHGLEHTTLYMSIDCGELIEVPEQTMITGTIHPKWSACFFAKPDEGYALTWLSASNNLAAGNGNLDALETGDNQSTWYAKSANSVKNNGGMTDAQVLDMTARAKALGCDGGFFYSRNTNNSAGTVLTDIYAVSEKLPTVEKDVDCILRGDQVIEYQDKMTVQQGDVIRFKVTVIEYGSKYGITYTKGNLTDELDGANFTETNRNTQSVDLRDKKQDHVYYVDYVIQEKDIGTMIENTVALSYDYSAKYSAGTFGGKAEADASVTAASFTLPDVVLDFGLAVDIKLEIPETAFDKKPFTSVTAAFGEVEFNEVTQTVTYTPDKGFLTREYTQLTAKKANGAEYPFRIHPASNVLYEAEDFMDGDWTRTPNELGHQTYDNEGRYGYDDAYNKEGVTGTLGSYNKEITSGKTNPLTTRFMGNAFDLIGECGPDTGMVLLYIHGENGSKFIIVDTSFVDGKNSVLHQVPWAHAVMPLGEYDVEITGYYRSETKSAASFGAAGVGISDTLYAIMDDLDARGVDLNQVEFVYFDEASPLAQMENATMMTLAEGDGTTEGTPDRSAGGRFVVDSFRVYTSSRNPVYIPSEKEITYTNVIKAVNDGFSAYVENTDGTWNKANYEIKGGPQNEIYLRNTKNEDGKEFISSAVFDVGAQNTLQITAKAVSGPVTMVVNGHEIAVNSNTEMYYDILEYVEDGVVTISVKDSGMLAIANIKSSHLLNPVTEETLQIAYAMLSAPVEPEPPVDPSEPEEPETFTPDLKAKANSKKQGNEKQVTVTITTSTDVEYIIIDGDRVDNWETSKNGKTRVFTYTDIIGGKEKHTYKIIAYNANGAASEPISVKG